MQPERPLLFAVLAGCHLPAFAQENISGVDLVASGGVETNPYNEANAPDVVGVANLEIRPFLTQSTDLAKFDLRGLVQVRQFTERYGLEDNYAVSGGMTARTSDRVSIRANARFSYVESGYGSSLASNTNVDPPIVTPVDPSIIDDVTLIGQRSRTTTVEASVGMDYQLSSRSVVSVDMSGRAMQFDSAGLGDYYYFIDEIRYSNILSEKTTVGGVLQLSLTDYRGRSIGDAKTTNALISVDQRFSERLTGSFSAGLAMTTINQGPGFPNRDRQTFTMQARLCRKGETNSFCVNWDNSPQPSANGGVRTMYSFGASYFQQLSARERYSLSANYGQASGVNTPPISSPKVQYYGGAASYENDFRENLTAFGRLSVNKIDQDGASRRANVSFMAGVKFKFGAPR